MKTGENTSFKKKLENFWYYYKTYTILAVVLGVIILFNVYQCSKTPKADFNIFCAYTGSLDFSAFEEKAAATVGDINGDGKTIVSCENLGLMGEPESGNDIAVWEKYLASFLTGETGLYILEKEFFDDESYAECFEDLNGILPAGSLEGGIEFEGGIIAIPAKNCPYLIDSGIEKDNLYVGIMRKTDNANADSLYDTSKRLICEMVK